MKQKKQFPPKRQVVEPKVPTGPLTDRQRQVLTAMFEREKKETVYGMSGNEIGYAVGFRPGDAMVRRGPAVKAMGPAQKVIGSMIGLERRGLIRWAARRDGRSGSAYRLTEKGKQEVLGMEKQEWGENMEPLDNPGDALYEVGQRVVMVEDHDMYPEEEVKIVARGKGKGFYSGAIVYDILPDDVDESWRVRESDISAEA
jgi:hypothetical protein